MESQVTEIDPVTIEVKVEVPWDRVRKGLDDTFGKLQKTARVKGFRPGKAPRNVIQQLFSKDVRQEVVSNLIEEGLIEAVKKHELPIVSNAQVKDQPSLTDGQPLAFSAKFEVRPKIESLVTDLELTRVSADVSDADVDADIERLRVQNSTLEPLETPRAAKKGDVVTIDYEVTIDGEKKADMKGEGRTVELGDGKVLTELEACLDGASVGDKRSATVARPKEDENQELAGKVVVFDVTVKDIQEKKLPALDDEFAKDLGEFESLAGLKTKTRERLELSAKNRAEGSLREQAVDKLVAANPVPVPPSLIDQQLRAMAQEFLQFMRMMGQAPNFDETMVGEMRGRAEQKVRAAILLGELSRRESIAVEASEVDAKLKEIADRTGKHIAKVKVDYQGEKREQLETQILETKLLDHLLSKAKIVDAPPASAAPSETK
jgi:trigger factor